MMTSIPRVPWALLGCALFLGGCNCENQVDGEEIEACVHSAEEANDVFDACDNCCIAEGYEVGLLSITEGADRCACGDVGTCDE